jgi:outer membrane protein assembly factor BamB
MTTDQRDQLFKAAIAMPSTVEAPNDLGDTIFREVIATRQQRGFLHFGWLGRSPGRSAALLVLAMLVLVAFAAIAVILSQRQQHSLLLAMYHGGPERTGVMVGPGPVGEPSIVWDVARPGPLPFTTMPLVQEGRVFVVDGSGTAAALDATSGATVWAAGLGAPARGTPVIAGGLLIVGTDDGRLVALRLADGGRAWAKAIGTAPISASLVEASGRVFAASEAGSVYAVDPGTGTVTWTGSVGGPVLHGAAVSAGVVFVGDGSGRLTAMDAATGAERWRVELGPGGVGTPAVANGSLFVSRGLLTSRGDLEVLDPNDGTSRWTFDAPSGQLVYAGAVTGSTVFVVSDDGHVYAVDLASHATRWTAATDGALGTLGVWVDGVFYTSSNGHSVYAFDAASGTQRWRIDVAGSPTQPAIVGGRVVLGTNLGRVISIGDGPGATQSTAPS